MKKHNKTLHLEEADLEPKFQSCPVCGSSTFRFIGSIQREPDINALQCKSCRLGFADRQPVDQILSDYYAAYYESDRKTTIKKELLMQHLLRFMENQDGSETYKILDFGGGDGSIGFGLAKEIVKKDGISSVQVYVVDPNIIKLENNESNIEIINVAHLKDFPSDVKVDFVIASAVMEHVKDPKTILNQLFDTMKPGARYYARTPYIFPFKSLFGKFGYELDMMFPGHLFDMGSRYWNGVLKKLGRDKDVGIMRSHTSLVETSKKEDPFGWLISHLFKIPSYLFKNQYHFVGGWEVVFVKK